LAVFHWLSNLAIPDAMLIFGQVLNASMVFAAYLFTTTLTEDRVAGVIAALITGFFTPMPAYYTSWGRYTQLAGLLILPAALVLTKTLMNKSVLNFHPKSQLSGKRPTFSILIFTGVLWAGLFLTHYRVVAFLGCLILVWLITYLLLNRINKYQLNKVLNSILSLILLGVLFLLLTLPWWPDFAKNLLYPMYTYSQVQVTLFEDFSWKYLLPASGTYVTALAFLGLLWGLIRKKLFALILLLWVCLLFLFANLGAIGLPGSSFVNNTSVVIIFFLPISTFCGYLISWVITSWDQIISNRWKQIYRGVIILLGVALTFIATRSSLPNLNPNTMLFSEPDNKAIEWIMDNIPSYETVLINPFSWGYGIYAGNDGGYWITPIAGHKTIPPPVLYASGGVSEHTKNIPDISRQVLEMSRNPTDLHAYLGTQEIDYIYLGARGGALSAKLLLESPLFQELYSEDGTWVFSLLPAP
jgi:hypothetical protein